MCRVGSRVLCWLCLLFLPQLDAVWRVYGSTFNHIHISAAITHLAQLNSRHRQQQSLWQQVQGVQQHDCIQQQSVQRTPGLELVKQQMDKQHQQLQHTLHIHRQQQPQHQGQNISFMLPRPSISQHDLQQRLLDQALQQLSALQPRQIANILWSLSQLQCSWRDSETAKAAALALLHKAEQSFSVAEGRHLAQIAYAAAKLLLPVKQEWVHSLQQAWLQHVEHCRQQLDQQQTADSGVPCEQSIQHTMCWQHSAAAGVVSPQAAANFLWALTHLHQQQQQQQQQPIHSAWLPRLMSVLAPDLTHWPARSVAVLVWSCAKLGYTVQQHQQPHVHQTVVQAIKQSSRTFSHRDIAQVMWGAAVMGLQLPKPVLQDILARGSEQIQSYQQLVLALDTAAGSSTSRESDCHAPAAPCGSAAAGMAHSVALVLWSLAKLKVPAGQLLHPRLLKPWLVALTSSCDQADSQSLAVAAWALCRLQLAGSCPGVVQVMVQAAAQQQVEQAAGGSLVPSRCIASLVWAAGHCTASRAVTAGMKLAARQQGAAGRLYKQQQSVLIQPPTSSLQLQLDSMPVPGAVPSGINSIQQSCSSSKLHEAVRLLLLASAGLLHPPQQQQAPHVPAVPGASLRDLSQVMWGVAKLQLSLPAAWWRQCITQLRHMLLEHSRRQQSDRAAQQEFAQSSAVAVWSLGLARVQVPRSLICTMQTLSAPLLQFQPDGKALLSSQSYVMLLVGFTRLCRAAAARSGSRQKHNLACGNSRGQQHWQPLRVVRCSTSAIRQPARSNHAQHQIRSRSSGCRRHPGRRLDGSSLQLEWLILFCTSTVNQLHNFTPDGLVAVLWALGRLRFNPGCHYLAAGLQQLQVLLPQCTARHLSLSLWSMVRLQYSPDPAVVQCIAEAFEQQTASASKADTHIMHWAQEQLRQLQVKGLQHVP